MKQLVRASFAGWEWLLVGLLILIGLLRIVATYDEVAQTYDEAIHIAAGLEWFEGRYTFQRENPPLARLFLAAGPYLAGARWLGPDSLSHRAATAEFDYYVGSVPRRAALMLGTGQRYVRHLTLARLGTLIFFVGAALIVWLWARRDFGAGAGLAATFFVTTLPPVLAHAGLATLDLALAATVTLAFWSLRLWLDDPSRTKSAMLGLAAAVAFLVKYSAALFLVVGIAAAILVYAPLHWKERLPERPVLWRYASGLALSLAIGLVPVLILFWFSPVRVLEGLEILMKHQAEGHPAYLLGETRMHGWWYFFPFAFLVKTPLPFIAFAALGLVPAIRQARSGEWAAVIPLVTTLAIMASVLPARINIGVRHILVVYPLLSMVAGLGMIRVARLALRRHLNLIPLGALLVWYTVVTCASHPDYLAYFNELARRHPERFLVDSDLDWGQDVGRLAEELRARGIEEVSLALFTSANLENFDLPRHRLLPPGEVASGWVAVSLYRLKVGPRGYSWLEAYDPVTTVGRSIRLYHIP